MYSCIESPNLPDVISKFHIYPDLPRRLTWMFFPTSLFQQATFPLQLEITSVDYKTVERLLTWSSE